MTLKSFILQLNRCLDEEEKSVFKRVHRSYLVNFKNVVGYDRDHVFVGEDYTEVPVTGNITVLMERLIPAFKTKPLPNVLILTEDTPIKEQCVETIGADRYNLEVSDSPTVIDEINTSVLDLAVIDIELSTVSGVDVARRLLRNSPVPIIFLSDLETDDELFKEAASLKPQHIVNKKGDGFNTRFLYAFELAIRYNSL